VQLRLGTIHRKDSLHIVGEARAESVGCSAQAEVEAKKRIRSEVPQDESQVSVGGMLALGYGGKKILREKR
jgi:hypothetical protein